MRESFKIMFFSESDSLLLTFDEHMKLFHSDTVCIQFDLKGKEDSEEELINFIQPPARI